ncbi:hypothetical protein AB9F45_36420, partial [Rhizobium leguminosarum]
WHPGHGRSTRLTFAETDFDASIDDLIRAPWIGEDDGGGKLQRLFVLDPGKQARQEDGGDEVAENIRRVLDNTMLSKKRVTAGKIEIAGT